jgi:hypothetical protein
MREGHINGREHPGSSAATAMSEAETIEGYRFLHDLTCRMLDHNQSAARELRARRARLAQLLLEIGHQGADR